MTQKEKNTLPKSGPQASYPLLRASENPATTPTMLTMRSVVGGIKSVVHFTMYSSPNSASSAALAVTVKFVSMPASILRKPWKTAKRWAETPPMTQNCSLRHKSSMLTPLHRSSRTAVTIMERKRPRKRTLARFES